MIIVMIIIYGLVIAVDLVPLIKTKSKKEIIILSIILLIGIVVSTMLIMRIEVPKPLQLLEEFIRDKLGIGYKSR